MTTELHQLYRDSIAQADYSEFRYTAAALRELYKLELQWERRQAISPHHFTPASSTPVTCRPAKQG